MGQFCRLKVSWVELSAILPMMRLILHGVEVLILSALQTNNIEQTRDVSGHNVRQPSASADEMSSGADGAPKAFSCRRCFERKVRCDKLNPCSNCAKSNVECIFRVPPPPRRRRRRSPDAALLTRLKRYEEVLKRNGIDVEDDQSPAVSSTTSALSPSNASQHSNARSTARSYDLNKHPAFLQYQDSQAGQLLVDRGKSRFIENTLWVRASSEVSRHISLKSLLTL